MDILIRVYANETVIHDQIASIEKLLNRKIPFEISLDRNDQKFTIEFLSSETEIGTLKQDLRLNVYSYNGIRWLPHL